MKSGRWWGQGRLMRAALPAPTDDGDSSLSDLLGGPLDEHRGDQDVASFESRTKTITRYEWAVPVGPYGTDFEELSKAQAAAHRKAVEVLGAMDATVRVFTGDDEIIFRVEGEKLERPTPVYRDADGSTTALIPVIPAGGSATGEFQIPRTGGPGSPQGAV
jgi:hypothetical protein